jgi:hypothetical protein
MDLFVLVGVFALALGAAILAARGLLGLIFHLMHQSRVPLAVRWRPVVFSAAIFWFWYLTPAFAESHAVARVLDLLSR